MKMLKIKDNVPLEKLKDFGFIIYQSIDDGEYYYCICNIFIGKDKVIRQDDGINCCKDLLDHNFSDYEVSILYNLITAGLVEKC